MSANTIKTNRIRATHPDSAIAFGDSTMKFDPLGVRLYNDATSFIKGISIGRGIASSGSALNGTLAYANGSTAIGYNVRVAPSAINAITIGSGITGVTSYINNTLPNTLMLGFNSVCLQTNLYFLA